MTRSRFAAAFASTMRRKRLAMRMTQEKLAEAAGLHAVTISMIETGKLTPTIEVAHRLARALGTSLSGLARVAERTTP